VAPHPDDETFGCGATILRKRAHGTPVRVVIVTDGRHSTKSAVISPEALAALRRREALDACSRLGLDSTDVIFLDYEDGKLETQLPDLTSRIAELIAAFRPDEVLVTAARDGHPDHRALNRATYKAVEDWPAVQLLEYPIWFWHPSSWVSRQNSPVRQGSDLLIRPMSELYHMRRYRVDATLYLDRKKEAMAAYLSQVTNLTGEPNWSTMAPWMLSNFTQPYEIFLQKPAGNGKQ